MSYLRNALSLETAGGIYFEGARVSSDERQLVLFIGLGGTGADALLHIKNQVANRMVLPMNEKTHMPTAEVPKNIAFMEFDTDYSSLSQYADVALMLESVSQLYIAVAEEYGIIRGTIEQ